MAAVRRHYRKKELPLDYACAQARARYEKDRYGARKAQTALKGEEEFREFLVKNDFTMLIVFHVEETLKSNLVTAVEILIKGELSRVVLEDDVYTVVKVVR